MHKCLKHVLLGFAALLAACGDEPSSAVGFGNHDASGDDSFIDAAGCSMLRIEDGYKVLCSGDSVGVILDDGETDESCTMAPVSSGYKVLCDGDSVAVIFVKKPSLPIGGDENGDDDKTNELVNNCSVEALSKGYRIICGGDSVDVVNENIKEKADISFRVVDFNTGRPITSALILSAGTNDSLYTDSLGVLTIKANVLGDYTFIVSKKGYASQIHRVSLGESGAGDVARVPDKFTDVRLHSVGVTVNGTVLYTNGNTGAVVGASNVKVILKFDDQDLYPSEVSTTTDELGVYSFSGLPESVGYGIYVPQTSIGGSTYASVEPLYASNLRSGERRDLATIRLGVVGLVPELVYDNLSGIDASDPVILQFSTELLVDSIAKSWKVYKGGYVSGTSCYDGISVLTNATLTNTTLSIKPVKGSWTDYDSYCVSGIAYSNDGQRAYVAKTFTPGDINTAVASITRLRADAYYDSYVKLTWKPTGDNIAGYKVYYKTDVVNDFREITNWNGYGTLPIDSSVCERVSDYSYCNQYRDISSSYNRMETNYYWYTDYESYSSTNSDDYYYYGYDDSTSYLNVWYIRDTVKTTSSGVYDFTRYAFLWSKKDTISCDVSYEEYYDYGYNNCDAYGFYGRSPNTSIRGVDDEVYYTYLWYVDRVPAEYDSCEVTSFSDYEYCAQYSTYGSYTNYHTNYYRVIASDSLACRTVSSTYAYENCNEYTLLRRNPDAQRSVYWKKMAIDSVACTVKSGYSMSSVPRCDSLSRAFGGDEYTSSYKSYDRNYVWYTDYANIRPLSTDSVAFVDVNQVFTNGVTSASFIVLPYITPNGAIITSSVVEADSVTFQKR